MRNDSSEQKRLSRVNFAVPVSHHETGTVKRERRICRFRMKRLKSSAYILRAPRGARPLIVVMKSRIDSFLPCCRIAFQVAGDFQRCSQTLGRVDRRRYSTKFPSSFVQENMKNRMELLFRAVRQNTFS